MNQEKIQAREALAAEVQRAAALLAIANSALIAFDDALENNVFASLEEAGSLEEVLYARAAEDCEGAYNCGADEYRQQFLCEGRVYEALLEVEYNRHDKTYYYVDGHKFSISKVAVH